jgi:DnaJ-domain-containing protein 1
LSFADESIGSFFPCQTTPTKSNWIESNHPPTVTRLRARKLDCYEVLGIQPGATPEEVKRAYRERAKSTHPDASRTQETIAEFMKVKEVSLFWLGLEEWLDG